MELNPNELFYSDNKLFVFDSLVVKRIDYSDKYGIVLDKTGFFPEAGGQKADAGTLNGIKVLDVQVTENGIEHFVSSPIDIGAIVHGELDKEPRLKKERNHTGEHIVSAVVHKLFGYNNVGFHMGDNGMDVDFDGSFTKEELLEIERQANRIVRENVAVKCYFPTEEELKSINYRSKLELSTPRIVEIVGYDYCACCAPHVSTTDEIGLIKIVDCYKNRGNTRLTLLCAEDAVEYVLSVCSDAEKGGAMLSAKPYSVSTAIAKQLKANEELSKMNVELKHTITQEIVSSLKPTDDYLVVFAPSYASKDILNKGLELTPKGVCIFSENDEGYTYVLASKTNDMRGLANALNLEFSGKGGGKPTQVQGRIRANKEQIEKFFHNGEKE